MNPKAIIDELRDSDLPAEVVLDRQRKIQIEAEMAEKEEALRKKREKIGKHKLTYVFYKFSKIIFINLKFVNYEL